MSKEAPIICDYIPKKNTLFSMSRQVLNGDFFQDSQQDGIFKKLTSWGDVVENIKKAASNWRNFMNEETISNELDKTVFNEQSEFYCDSKINTEGALSFIRLFYTPKVACRQDVIPGHIGMTMQDKLSLLMNNKRKLSNGDVLMPDKVNSKIDVDLSIQKADETSEEEKEFEEQVRENDASTRLQIKEEIYSFPKVCKN